MEYHVTRKDCHSMIKEKMVYLFYQLNRKTSNKDIQLLSLEFGELLKKIKRNMSNISNVSNETIVANVKYGEKTTMNIYYVYLIFIYKMIAQTRDIEDGKGERTLTYMLIYTMYKYFPVLAVYAIKIIVQPFLYQGNYFPSFGCWRDIAGLCEYIRLCSPNSCYDPLIDTCVDILVDQLQKDYKIYKSKKDSPHKQYKSISLVAKWVPREHKKNDWLYLKIVIEWSKREWNYILNSAKKVVQYNLAVNKCCRKFRKLISELNRELDTFEIKECSQNMHLISPEKINTATFIKKNKQLMDNKNIDMRTFLYSKKYFEGMSDINNNNLAIYGTPNEMNNTCYRIRNIPISYYVKKAFEILEKYPNDTNHDEYHFLNSQWKYMLKYYKNIDNAIPIIDISMTLEDDNREPLYNAIGIACLISEKSSIKKRMIFIHSNHSEWINLSNCENFISMIHEIKYIRDEFFHKGNESNIKECMQLILHSIHSIKMSFFSVEKIVLVVLQNNIHYSHHKYIMNLFSGYLQPHIVYWNVSLEINESLPTEWNNSRITLISGWNPSVINFLSFMDIKSVRNFSPYDTIVNILNNKRYDIMENIFMELAF
jgi:hypothetical protein